MSRFFEVSDLPETGELRATIKSVETTTHATIACLRGIKPLLVDGTIMTLLARDLGPNMYQWPGREVALSGHRAAVTARGLPVRRGS